MPGAEGKEEVRLRDKGSEVSGDGSPPVKARLLPQLAVTAVTSLAPLILGFSFGFSSPAGPDLETKRLTTDQVAWFSSLLLFGAMVGSTLGAFLVVRVGGKMSLTLLNIPFFLGWLLVILAEESQGGGMIAMLYIGRILHGVGVGITTTAQPVYVAEITSKEKRGLFASSFQLCVNTGFLLSYVFGLPFYYRWLAVIPAALSILMTGLMFLLPETPRFLLSRGKNSSARSALIRLRGSQYDIDKELQETQDMIDAQKALGKLKMRDFLNPGIYRPFLIAISLMIFQNACGILAVLSYSETIFENAGFSGKGDMASIILGIIFTLAVLPAAFLMDRAGRRLLLILSQSIMAVSLVTMGLYYYLTLEKSIGGLSWLSMGSLIVYIAAFSLGIGPVPFVLMGEMFPLRARGVGMGTATIVSWTCAFIITKNFPDMVEAMKEYGTFWFFAGFTCLGLAVTVLFIPETKGKSLEEIQIHFMGQSPTTMSQDPDGKDSPSAEEIIDTSDTGRTFDTRL